MPSVSYSLTPVCTKRLLFFFPNVLSFTFASCHILTPLKRFSFCSLKESGKIRRTVQLGIEKIRAVDERHGLHVQLLIYLGKSFGSKVCTAVNSTKQDKACGSGAESQFVVNRLI